MYSITSGESSVKPSVVAALVAGAVLLLLTIRKKTAPMLPMLTDSNIRYDIDEYISDDEL